MHRNTKTHSGSTVFDILAIIAEFCHRQLDVSHRELLETKWGLRSAIVDSQKIGYCSEGQNTTELLLDFLAHRGISTIQALETGFFYRREDGGIVVGFRGRIIFWYWSQGIPRYAIGRRTDTTPRTPDKSGKFVKEQAKYKKLSTRSLTRPFVSPLIRNQIFNSDAVESNQKLIVTEGITDALALMQVGFENVVSPVTTRFSKSDALRLKELFLC